VTNISGSHTLAVPVFRAEANLVRCEYTQALANNPQQLFVRVVTNATHYSSNLLEFKFNSQLTGLLTTDVNTFLRVRRFQCREHTSVPYMFEPGSDGSRFSIYDPLQSESDRLSYPLNFYTTNMGAAALWFVLKAKDDPSIKDWDCSFGLEPEDNPALWVNRNIYSESPWDGGADSSKRY